MSQPAFQESVAEPLASSVDELSLLRTMILIRQTEMAIEKLHHSGQIAGSFHSSYGQEAAAAGVCAALRIDDLVTSTHRGHGHAIAKGVPIAEIIAELHGYQNGCSGGRGGSMHLHHLASGFMGENAIVAGGMPWAAGAAWAARRQNKDIVGVSFTGDGGGAQGLFSETLRMARSWGTPTLFICENNHFAHSMPSEQTFGEPGSFAAYAKSFGITAEFVAGDDVVAVYNVAQRLVSLARETGQPAFLEIEVWRVRAHSLNDPDYRYRPRHIGDEYLRLHDPVAKSIKRLDLTEKQVADLDSSVLADIDQALAEASQGAPATPDSALSGVYSPELERLVLGS